MQAISEAWEGQSRRNWNTVVRQAHQPENEDMPGKSLNEGTGT
jgi:hypothetical protein